MRFLQGFTKGWVFCAVGLQGFRGGLMHVG